ncbi:hypothetical protein MHBO_000102 [Bonamia ostreae]|uniref:Uncharacterized protein n=1 Tax=Bonamia ostreae TaxID=126728 RepID=A0ABV2AEC4_9EUKA
MSEEIEVDAKLSERRQLTLTQEKERQRYRKIKKTAEKERRAAEKTRRITQVNVTSFDKNLNQDLNSYYCAFCGAFAIVMRFNIIFRNRTF